MASEEQNISERHKSLFTAGLSASAMVIGFLVFLVLDMIYSVGILDNVTRAQTAACQSAHPIRHHAFTPNCSAERYWGTAAYEVHTNSLGFRDARVRDVAASSDKPRVLMLGDSFTAGPGPWAETYVGMVANKMPEIAVLNGGVDSYSPANYLNVVRELLAKGYEFDEVIVFADISDIQDEAAVYADRPGRHGVEVRDQRDIDGGIYAMIREKIRRGFVITNVAVEWIERGLVSLGIYHLPNSHYGDVFSMPRSAWTDDRGLNTDSRAFPAGYAPLGVEGGINRARSKMSELYGELTKRGIALSVVVYPWPAQILSGQQPSRHEKLWRQWCEGRCVRFVSVYLAFMREKANCPQFPKGCWYRDNFIFGDVHYNRRGNELVAKTVIAAIREMPIQRRKP
ncbi:MAG: hypothetical protein HOK25_06320 [Rhodospirillaceae bacterium]|nr:hypothetical protein [Rhodospirillaceae bacterium]